MSESRPAPHPDSPEDLASRKLPLVQLEIAWFRIHKSQYSPLYYGYSGRNRFDAPKGEYGVMYVGADSCGCFIETFGWQTGYQVVAISELRLYSMSQLQSQRQLSLVDLTGSGLARIGADARLCNGEHRLAQKWALSLWSHPENVDGIYYRARHDPSRYCAAIFDRAQADITIAQTQSCWSDDFRETLAYILDTYEFGLV